MLFLSLSNFLFLVGFVVKDAGGGEKKNSVYFDRVEQLRVELAVEV